MKIYLNAQYKCVKVEDNTFVANSTSNFIRYYFVQNADGTLADEITENTEVYLNQEPSYVTLGFRRADGNTIQHLMATPKTEGTEAFWEYVITETDGVLYKKGALEVSAQFINATLNSENKIISQKVMAVAINTAHILDNIGEEAEEYYSQYEQANNEAHAALQAQITEKFNNIGVMGSLTTDNKNTLVEAINEVDEHADKAQNDVNKLSDDIGDKLSLTTDEKNTIVGAINEVDNHADTAQTTADSAIQTANNAKTVADTAKSIADSASQTANQAKTTANNASATANAIAGTANQAMTIAEQAKTIATNSVYSVSFEDIQSAVTALNGYDNAYFKVGNSIYLKQKDVPDMWVYAVASEYVEYTYTTDDDFVNALLLGTVQVGYYVLANLESTGDYDVLKDIPILNQDLSADGFAPVENTYYRHTGTTSETYTNGVVYFYNGTAYKAIDGAGGEVPTSLPATGAKITGNLPTSGWATAGGANIFYGASNPATQDWQILDCNNEQKSKFLSYPDSMYANFTPYGTKKLVRNTSYTNQYNTSDANMLAIRYNNTNGQIEYKVGNSAYENKKEVINWIDTRETPPNIYTYNISDTAIKANSTVSMYLNSADEVRAYSKADGSVVVEMDNVPTTAIPYTLQVVETSAEGAFEIVNSYVPTIPETPTALPQEASALKSGNLPTSGWTNSAQVLLSSITLYANDGDTGVKALNKSINSAYYNYTGLWEFLANGKPGTQTSSPSSIISIAGKKYRKIPFVQWSNMVLYIDQNGNLFSGTSKNYLTGVDLKALDGLPVYTISDTSITANSDVLMELTDEGGVEANALANGSITVIRDTVPTQPIPYTYKVKQTNASGQFTVINHYTPEIPEVPTTTTLYEDSTGAATVTLSETINNGDIVRIKTNNGNVDHYYIGVAWNRTIAVTESSMVTDESDVTVGTAINIDSLRFNIQDTSLILFHYFNTNITTAGAVTITNEKANVVIRKVERIHA